MPQVMGLMLGEFVDEYTVKVGLALVCAGGLAALLWQPALREWLKACWLLLPHAGLLRLHALLAC